MNIGIITLFPEIFTALQQGIIGRAIKKGILRVTFWNPRDFTKNKHQTVDDRPYGGGPGMVMMVAPLKAAIEAAKKELGQNTPVVYLSPQGQVLKQEKVVQTAKQEKIILLAGRYKGIDERLVELIIDEEWSIGDYVLSGGEFVACVVIDAITRLLPGALGDETSAEQDSFSAGLLDHPHYTRPEIIEGLKVPDVLISGDHVAIAKWRLQKKILRTRERRSDLWEKYKITSEEQALLTKLNRE